MNNLLLKNNQCLYFGVWSSTSLGHSLYNANGTTLYERDPSRILPFPYKILDGLFYDQEQSRIHLIFIKGWTIMWFSDRSGDSRGNSCSAFLFSKDNVSFEEMKNLFQITYPKQFERIEKIKPLFE